MKVLLINEVYGILSTGRTVKELSEGIIRQGDECLIATAYGMKDKEEIRKMRRKGHYIIGFLADRKLHALCSRITGLQGYFSHIPTLGLLRYIKKKKPDIVQLENVHGNYLNLNMLLNFLVKEDIPTVLLLHDCWFYTGRCTHYTVNGCYQWREECKKCPNNRNTPPSWFFDRCNKMWKDKKENFQMINKLAVIGVSDWITNQAKCSFLKDACLIKRIYNWIDFDNFKPMDAADIRKDLQLEDKFVILSVASLWDNTKGLKGFLKLAEKLQEEAQRKAGNADYKECVLLMVGSIPEYTEVPNNVQLIPRTNSLVSLARLYNAADVYISLSKEESFGKTIAEALACGTPAITFSATALPELVGKNCGYLVADNTLRSVYKGLCKIRSKGKAFYSEACTDYARKYFSMEENVKEYRKVYKRLITKTP